jgi:hypothetical protein
VVRRVVEPPRACTERTDVGDGFGGEESGRLGRVGAAEMLAGVEVGFGGVGVEAVGMLCYLKMTRGSR